MKGRFNRRKMLRVKMKARKLKGKTRLDCPRCGSLTRCAGCRQGNENGWK